MNMKISISLLSLLVLNVFCDSYGRTMSGYGSSMMGARSAYGAPASVYGSSSMGSASAYTASAPAYGASSSGS